MSKGLIYVIIIFIVVVYIYTFVKWKKRRERLKSSDIDAFKKKFAINGQKNEKEQNDADILPDMRIDYVDKSEYYSAIQAEVQNSTVNKNEKKKFELKF